MEKADVKQVLERIHVSHKHEKNDCLSVKHFNYLFSVREY